MDITQPVAESSAEAGLGRAFVMGTVIGCVVVFLVLGGISLAVGLGVGPAIAIGAFTAFWGGPGFGGMMGAVLHHSRTEGH